jgi:hypothetical protein
MGIDNLGVAFNFSAGNITATGSTALQGVSATSLLIGPDELGIGASAGLAAWVDGKLRATDNLETAARLRADTVEPFSGAAVRVSSGLVVDGSLTVAETDVMNELGGKQDQLTQEGFGTELLYESKQAEAAAVRIWYHGRHGPAAGRDTERFHVRFPESASRLAHGRRCQRSGCPGRVRASVHCRGPAAKGVQPSDG